MLHNLSNVQTVQDVLVADSVDYLRNQILPHITDAANNYLVTRYRNCAGFRMRWDSGNIQERSTYGNIVHSDVASRLLASDRLIDLKDTTGRSRFDPAATNPLVLCRMQFNNDAQGTGNASTAVLPYGPGVGLSLHVSLSHTEPKVILAPNVGYRPICSPRWLLLELYHYSRLLDRLRIEPLPPTSGGSGKAAPQPNAPATPITPTAPKTRSAENLPPRAGLDEDA